MVVVPLLTHRDYGKHGNEKKKIPTNNHFVEQHVTVVMFRVYHINLSIQIKMENNIGYLQFI